MAKKSLLRVSKRVTLGTNLRNTPKGRQHSEAAGRHALPTFHVILGDVAVLVEDLLHAAESDGGQVPGILQLQETLEVASCLASSQVDALAVSSI